MTRPGPEVALHWFPPGKAEGDRPQAQPPGPRGWLRPGTQRAPMQQQEGRVLLVSLWLLAFRTVSSASLLKLRADWCVVAR